VNGGDGDDLNDAALKYRRAEDLVLTQLNSWRDSMLLARKAVGRIQRHLVRIPDHPVIAEMHGRVRFEHICLPFLDEGDFRAMLTQSYDIILCDYLKRNVRPGDIVLDVGANVGYISAHSAACAGSTGEVHGFEPLGECFARLERLRELNPRIRFIFNNVALGEKEGSLPIAYNPQGDSRNASLVPGKHSGQIRQVPVRRLDKYIEENISSPERISLIKIDVEGFEYSVLRGLEKFFRETPFRPLIVCEVKPWELSKLGATSDDFDRYMNGFGYRTSLIARENRTILLSDLKDMDVVVFRAG
jgi:FkbM family methyltransferase